MIRLFFVILFFSCVSLSASTYLPKVICYDKETYQAGRQNWDIDIDQYGIVYFGNSNGLLYNVYGEWALATMSEPGLVRTVMADHDSIWCASSEFGYFIRQNGQMVFYHVGQTDGDQIWNMVKFRNQIIMQSSYKLYIYDKISHKTDEIEIPGHVYSIIVWNEKVWMVLASGEIGYIENNTFTKVSQFEELKNREVRKIFLHKDKMFFVLFDGDVYTYMEDVLAKIDMPEVLQKNTLFSGLSYDENSYCLGSISNGFFHLDDDGNILRQVNATHGLIDNTILSMKCDALGNVWLGLDYGIAKIELQSAINNIFEGGATYSIRNFQGNTYLATNKGLFISSEKGAFEMVPNTGGQVWNLKIIDNSLFVCHNKGMLILKDGSIKNVAPYSGFIDVARFEGTDYYLFSSYQELILIHKVGDRYDYIRNLNIWGNSSLIYDKENKCIWGEMNGQDIVKISLDGQAKVSSERIEGVTHIFDTEIGIFFNNEEHILQYENGAFEPSEHPLVEKVVSNDIESLNFGSNGNSVAYIQKGEVKLGVLLPDGNIYSYNTLLKSLGKLINDERKFVDIQNNKLRLATDRGVTVFDIDFHTDFKKYSKPVISSVSELNDEKSKMFFPFAEDGIKYNAGNKDLKFSFSINKSMYDVVEYRYKLEPEDQEWSEWSSDKDQAFYAQLKGGKYHLYLQSRINGGEVNESSLLFHIDKKWYQTAWVLLPVLMLVFFIGFIMYYIMLTISQIKLKKQEKIYAENEASKTISLKNEQLLQYTEIISHKNEFLNKLKVGLESMRNTDAKRWANMINDEVNNEKKEFLFHKLFSEIHQDFIARLTEKFPNLTSNDIRVLSFIRANLENKEISNLMNISPRSLDTNRYRLRKKLNLEQGVDLNQFVRDF